MATQSSNQTKVDNRPTNGLAIAALICAILVPLVGLILGIIALSQLKKDPSHKGRGLAIAAIVVGIVLMLLFLLFVVIGMMAYFMVLNPTNFLSSQTEFPGPMTNVGPATVDYDGGTVTVSFLNTLDSPITLTTTDSQLKINGQQCSSITYTSMMNGEFLPTGSQIPGGSQFEIRLSCTDLLRTQTKGRALRIEMSFDYVPVNSGLKQTEQGQISVPGAD